MDLLNKLTIKNLKFNKKRTIVTIIGIILSVALVSAVATMYSSAINSLINYEIYEFGNFHYEYQDVSKEDVQNIQNNFGIAATYLTSNIGYAKLNDSKNEYKPYAYIKAFSKESLDNLSVHLVEGRLPENASEIIIPTHLKTNGRINLKVGDYITLDVGKRVGDSYLLNQEESYDPESNEHLIDTISKTYQIVGIAERPNRTIEPYNAPGYTFITYLDSKDIPDKVDVYAKYNKTGLKNHVKVTANILGVEPDLLQKFLKSDYLSASEYDSLEAQMKNSKYQFNNNNYLITLETNPLDESTTRSLGTVVLIVCLIIVFTSVFCIKNSFDISITEKTKQYGMLRSVGATKKQIRKNVFYEASILGLIGIPLGLLFGLLAAYILVIVSNFFLNKMMAGGLKLTFSYSPLVLLFTIGLGIITIYFSAFKSARRASKISPIDSIKNSADLKIKARKLKTPKLISKIFGIGGEISYKNQQRNKKKYRTTVISIAVSVCTFIALASFMSLAFQSIKEELGSSGYNIYLSVKNYNDTTYQKLIETTKLDNIKDVVVRKRSNFGFSNKHYSKDYLEWHNPELSDDIDAYLTIFSLNDEAYKKYLQTLNLDYETLKDKGVLIDKYPMVKYDNGTNKEKSRILREFDFQVGDTIKGNISDNPTSIVVGALSDKYPFGFENYNQSILVVSEDLYKTLPTKSTYVEALYYSTAASKLQDEIEEIVNNEDYELYNNEERVEMMRNFYILVGIFLYGFIIVISLIGITNIFNTITTNMQLRRSEFATLKSIGMTTKEFSKMIRLESIFMTVKSLIVGIILGTGLSVLIYHYLASSDFSGYKLPIIPIIISIVAVYLLITLLMKYSLRKINKQNIIETIRNENI